MLSSPDCQLAKMEVIGRFVRWALRCAEARFDKLIIRDVMECAISPAALLMKSRRRHPRPSKALAEETLICPNVWLTPPPRVTFGKLGVPIRVPRCSFIELKAPLPILCPTFLLQEQKFAKFAQKITLLGQ